MRLAGLLVFVLVVAASIARAQMGVGVNYTGVHVRFGEQSFFEPRFQADGTTQALGARLFWMTGKPASQRLLPYFGVEGDAAKTKYAINGGYIAGGFSGFELSLSQNLALDLDGGLYYIELSSSQGITVDWGFVVNSGLTYYFDIPNLLETEDDEFKIFERRGF